MAELTRRKHETPRWTAQPREDYGEEREKEMDGYERVELHEQKGEA